MSAIRTPHVPVSVHQEEDEYRRWVYSRLPQMAALLDWPDDGTSPTFLDIMAAISEIVAFTTEGDQNHDKFMEEIFCMSGKICRFCC